MRPRAPAIQIGVAGPLDVPLIAILHADCFADGVGGAVWSEGAIAQILAMPGAWGLLATTPPTAAGGGAVGFTLGRGGGGECEILSLGVPRAWRRRGIGRALVRGALAQAATLGAGRLYLEVAQDNSAARRLYGSEGFTAVARRPAYYRRRDGTMTALVLARDIV